MHIPFQSVALLNLEFLRSFVTEREKKRLSDLKVFDLVSDAGRLLVSNHGVYLFFDASGRNCLYVGKNSSNQFVERIPSHFAQSDGSWSNHFIKYFRKFNRSESLFQATLDSGSCHLILIQVEREYIGNAERILRVLFDPKFNSLAGKPRHRAGLRLESSFSEAIK
jgi:hypothetical protein